MAVRDVVQAAAGVGGGGEYVEDVFSTYLFTGTGTTTAITNGIDLDGEGGLVWIKDRDSGAKGHALFDTERGGQYKLQTSWTGAQTSYNNIVFNSDGFTNDTLGDNNGSGTKFASWTFRKAPKFFDVVTWTGDGTSTREIPHNLGSTPGCVIFKVTSTSDNWNVWHRGLTSEYIELNTTNAQQSQTTRFGGVDPTSTVFTVGSDGNYSGQTFVAYLFAHDAGGFGDDGEQNVISCGSYTGNGSIDGPEIDLGYEAQWVLIKRADSSANWILLDTMRGWTAEQSDGRGLVQYLIPNTSDAELANNYASPKAYGFKITDNGAAINGSGGNFIYIAIRRGPMKTPESGTEVFAIDTSGATAPTPPAFNSGFPVDMAFYKQTDGSSGFVSSRLTSNAWMALELTQAETANAGFTFDFQDGWRNNTQIAAYRYSWMFRRAPSVFDVVAYTGNGTAGRTVAHNLGVAPEMMIVKKRNNARDWKVYHSASGNGKASELNATGVPVDSPAFWNDTTPTNSVFSVGSSDTVNGSGDTFIAYLFATLDGVSKVGSYVGNGTSQTIDCGFSTGARFVLLKRYNANGYNWQVFDTARGITVGNDAMLALNTTAAESVLNWGINPNSAGFEVTGNGLNETGGEWLFYAIA